MGPRYSNIGAAQALLRAGAKSLDRRLARHDRGVRGRRRGSSSPRRRASRARASRPSCRSRDANSIDPASWCRPRGRRRRDPRLHPRHGTGAHEGCDRPGPRRQGEVGLVDADRQRRSWRGSSRSSTARCTSTRSSTCSTSNQGPDTRADAADPEEVRTEHPAAGVRPDGLPGREVRNDGAAERQGRRHREVLQRGGQGAQERQDGHALQAVVRRATRCRTTSRTTRTSRSTTRTARSC